MTEKTKKIEKEFNESLPQIRRGELGGGKVKFNKALFLKSAKELQEIVETNDREHIDKPAALRKYP